MTVTSMLRARVRLAIVPILLWACASSDPTTPSGDDSNPHVNGSKAGSSSVPDEGEGGGSPSEEPSQGSGNTGSVGEHEPEPQPGEGGKGNQPGEPGPDPSDGGEPSETPPEPPPHTEGYLRGEALVVASECAMCHTENFAGFTVFPNITPDAETGIGKWSDAQIVAAIRDGVDPDGGKLCETMMRYPFSDEQAADVVEFLRGIPSVSNRLTSDCP